MSPGVDGKEPKYQDRVDHMPRPEPTVSCYRVCPAAVSRRSWAVGEVAQFGRGGYKSGEAHEDRLVPASHSPGDKQRADEHEWGNIIIRDKVKGFSQRFTGPI